MTAASSSSISDGAAAIVIASESAAKAAGLKPLARLVSYASHAQAPEWFTTAPGSFDAEGARPRGLEGCRRRPVRDQRSVRLRGDGRDARTSACGTTSVNVNGGACAMGHPVGATGARIITTLLYALRKRGLRRGVASQCIGGGEACAVAIELL